MYTNYQQQGRYGDSQNTYHSKWQPGDSGVITEWAYLNHIGYYCGKVTSDSTGHRIFIDSRDFNGHLCKGDRISFTVIQGPRGSKTTNIFKQSEPRDPHRKRYESTATIATWQCRACYRSNPMDATTCNDCSTSKGHDHLNEEERDHRGSRRQGRRVCSDDEGSDDDLLRANALRKRWSKGDEVEVYSKRQQSWFKGTILGIGHDQDGEFLSVRYVNTMKNKTTTKDLDRYAYGEIRPIQNAKKDKTRDIMDMNVDELDIEDPEELLRRFEQQNDELRRLLQTEQMKHELALTKADLDHDVARDRLKTILNGKESKIRELKGKEAHAHEKMQREERIYRMHMEEQRYRDRTNRDRINHMAEMNTYDLNNWHAPPLNDNAMQQVSWEWQENNGQWKQYSKNITWEIEKLNPNDSNNNKYMYVFARNKQTYQITRQSNRFGIQINTQTNVSRQVRRLKSGDDGGNTYPQKDHQSEIVSVKLRPKRVAQKFIAQEAPKHAKSTFVSEDELTDHVRPKRVIKTADNQKEIADVTQKSIAQGQLKHTESTFVSEDEFAKNIINCQKANGVDLSDKFIHIKIDDSDPKQIQNAANLATLRAFEGRFVPPITNIIKGKAVGEMSILLPSGLTNKYTFNAKQTVYRGTATIKVKETSAKTFTCDVYFDVNFNLICRTNDVNSSKVSFTADDGTVSCAMDNSNASVNGLYQDVTKKLQHKYLVKMDESDKINKVYHSEIIPESDVLKITTTKPKESCRAYFTGGVVGQESVAYKIDAYSEYVGQGEYPKNREAFPKAVANTFDGIAIDRNTRVVIYEKENFEGKILLDARGPKIVNNGIWKDSSGYAHCNTDTWSAQLQKNFPIDVRIWTETDMHQWSYGSVKILSNAANQ